MFDSYNPKGKQSSRGQSSHLKRKLKNKRCDDMTFKIKEEMMPSDRVRENACELTLSKSWPTNVDYWTHSVKHCAQ